MSIFSYGAASSGLTVLSHISAFAPTRALVIGLDLPVPGVGDGKTHLVMAMDAAFMDASAGKLFSQVFPGVGGQPRLGHDTLIAAMQAAAGGNAAALGVVTNFFLTGAGAFAAFDPHGGFAVAEFSFITAIGAPEPASLAMFLAGLAGLTAARGRRARIG